MKKGFTLIELLVVVLIIGILSAVALPQYTKAVNRAKAVEAWTVMNAIANAQEIYYLANDKFGSREELDIEIPEMKNWDISSWLAIDVAYFIDFAGKNAMKDYRFSYNRVKTEPHQDYPKRIICWGEPEKCKNMLPCLGIGSDFGAFCYL